MDMEEPALDDVVNDGNQPQDDADPMKDNSTWFKQPPRPETPDPEWNKDPNHQLKKDKITKADLEGPVFKLLKGTWRSSIELEYHLEQHYLTFSKQMDWTNPKGDICRYELSKPLPLQGPLGHLTIPDNFFFNNDLEYLKTRNSERKYTISITKTKSTSQNRRDLLRDITTVRLEVLRFDINRSNVRIGIIPTKTELALEQTQQGASNEVLMLSGIEDSHHGPSDANAKPSGQLKSPFSKTHDFISHRDKHVIYRLSHSELVDIEKVTVSSSL
ncbi:hypothetical protein Tco_0716129 [Tanacetum coccineum]